MDEFWKTGIVVGAVFHLPRCRLRPGKQQANKRKYYAGPSMPPPRISSTCQVPGKLLSSKFQFYIFTCRQSFWNGHFYIFHITYIYQQMAGTFLRMGGCHLLCTSICRGTFSYRCNQRCYTGYFHGLPNECYLQQKNGFAKSISLP